MNVRNLTHKRTHDDIRRDASSVAQLLYTLKCDFEGMAKEGIAWRIGDVLNDFEENKVDILEALRVLESNPQ